MSRQKVKTENQKRAEAAIKYARRMWPCDFVTSCEKFYKSNGFLTEKQIGALNRIRMPRYEGPDHLNDMFDEYDYGFDPTDLYD